VIDHRVVGHRVDRGVQQDGVPRESLPCDGDFTDDAGHRTKGEVFRCHDAPRAKLAQRLADDARKQRRHVSGDRPDEGFVGRHVLDPEGVPPRIELEDLVNEVEHRSSIGGGLLRTLELTDHDLAKRLRGEEGGDEVDRQIRFETVCRYLGKILSQPLQPLVRDATVLLELVVGNSAARLLLDHAAGDLDLELTFELVDEIEKVNRLSVVVIDQAAIAFDLRFLKGENVGDDLTDLWVDGVGVHTLLFRRRAHAILNPPST
jgi:hypothetical protein